MPVGLPRSGKSTWARSTGFPIVSPDAIRLSLHGKPFRPEAENLVWAMAYHMTDALFYAGHEKVILDATNITEKRRTPWRDRYGEVQIHIIPTSPEVCIERARAQGDFGLIGHIERMAGEWDVCPPPWENAA